MTRLAEVLFFGVIAMVVAGAVAGAVYDPAAHEQYVEQAEAYCYQVYGDADLYNAKAMGNHGGLHCAANDDDPHLHDVTDAAFERAYAANQTGEPVSFDGIQQYEQRRWWHPRESMVGLGLLLGGVILGASVLLRMIGKS